MLWKTGKKYRVLILYSITESIPKERKKKPNRTKSRIFFYGHQWYASLNLRDTKKTVAVEMILKEWNQNREWRTNKN